MDTGGGGGGDEQSPPSQIVRGGIEQGALLPCINMLEKYCVVHHMGGDFDAPDGNTKNGEGRDYHRIRSGVDVPGRDKKCGDYFYLNPPGEEGHDKLFFSLREHSPPDAIVVGQEPLTLEGNFRRKIRVSRYHSNVVSRFAFDELCDIELGSSDYHAIAKHFRVVMIVDIPRMTLAHHDRARRFITLIDELYEAGCCLACTAVDILDRLFVGKAVDSDSDGDGNDLSNRTDDVAETSAHKILAVDVAQARGYSVGQLASVKELSFAFGRAASRLFGNVLEDLVA